MNWLETLRMRIRMLFRRGRESQRLDAELQYHLDRQIAENIEEVFYVIDPACSKLFYVSPAYEKLWGRSCASLYESPLSWMDSIHEEDRQITGMYDVRMNDV